MTKATPFILARDFSQAGLDPVAGDENLKYEQRQDGRQRSAGRVRLAPAELRRINWA